MNTTNKATPKKRYVVETEVFCKCDHISYIHGDKGNGACEGIYTSLDRDDLVRWRGEPCPCQKFEAAS